MTSFLLADSLLLALIKKASMLEGPPWQITEDSVWPTGREELRLSSNLREMTPANEYLSSEADSYPVKP